MNKEEMQNYHIEMLIQDLEEHSLEYWKSTQDKMVESLRNLQQENKQLKANMDEAIELINKYRNKNYGSLEKKSFYCSKTDKLLSILERSKEC